MCDDVHQTVAELTAKGAEFNAPSATCWREKESTAAELSAALERELAAESVQVLNISEVRFPQSHGKVVDTQDEESSADG